MGLGLDGLYEETNSFLASRSLLFEPIKIKISFLQILSNSSSTWQPSANFSCSQSHSNFSKFKYQLSCNSNPQAQRKASFLTEPALIDNSITADPHLRCRSKQQLQSRSPSPTSSTLDTLSYWPPPRAQQTHSPLHVVHHVSRPPFQFTDLHHRQLPWSSMLQFHCLIVNLEKLWSIVPEEVKDKAVNGTGEAPLLDVTQFGYFKVFEKGKLPRSQPLVVQTKLISKVAEKKIKEAGGAVVVTHRHYAT
ncbi:hypothetical protein M0R45_034879 [Rubus argutus]|uniref:Large ribosomal subunit protein uL15/eL18 domain-containing protein n=1 Tax=Rubus argutus TaxID=59490 RepID=A0AAW1VWV8_RUBAR